MLSEKEWDHVRYLVVLLRPYAFWTDALSNHTGPTINKAWLIYTRLFAHLEKYAAKLQLKDESWKQQLSQCVTAAHGKLAKYYRKTEGAGGKIYNLACVLDPARKLSLYRSAAFEAQYADIYEKEFRDYYEANYAHFDDRQSDRASSQHLTSLDLDKLMDLEVDDSMRSVVRFQQLDEYLESAPTRDRNPLLYWQSKQSASPGLAQMAKDFLSVPISGVGVERAFSKGRLVCHYLRNQLYPETIKRLMILRQHWGLAQKDKSHLEGERVKATVADKDSHMYGQKDFDIALRAEISDDDEAVSTQNPVLPTRATTKRSARSVRRKA